MNDPEASYTLADVTVEPGASESWNFDTDSEGQIPAGGLVHVGSWAVRNEAGTTNASHSLCQTGDEPFTSLSLGGSIYGDLTATTRFKPIDGQVDQAAGILFGVQNSDNYYIVRANALENNVAWYVYVDGARSQIGVDGNVSVEQGTWQELSVTVRGHEFNASLDGEVVATQIDDRYEAGGVGLWTKADSHTCFDDVTFVAE